MSENSQKEELREEGSIAAEDGVVEPSAAAAAAGNLDGEEVQESEEPVNQVNWFCSWFMEYIHLLAIIRLFFAHNDAQKGERVKGFWNYYTFFWHAWTKHKPHEAKKHGI